VTSPPASVRRRLTEEEGTRVPDHLAIADFTARYGAFRAVADVSLTIEARAVTAFIGPSGCGKSTLLRSINRLHEAVPGASVEGSVTLNGEDLYGPAVDPVEVRRRIGMVFQRPNPFPGLSIRDNVLAGVKLRRHRLAKADADAVVESSLRAANLWDEVKDRLGKPGLGLSGGQQQRLCIARAIAVEPAVLLMDEPCSALDPLSTLAIEDLMASLRQDYTVVIVTHNMQQAARISDKTAFFSMDGPRQPGRLVEYGPTTTVFSRPGEQATADYIAGRFG
jgi:phosphate transport system ATP-binding protein